MSETENKQFIRQAFEAWAAGTGGVFDLLTPDATWTIVGNSAVAGMYRSRKEFMDRVIRPFNARMATPLTPVLHALYADGDTVIAYFEASATPRDGKPYQNTYTWYLQVCDKSIVEAIPFFDSIEVNDLWSWVQPA